MASVKGLKTSLEEVIPGDAEAICLLRNDDRINRYLSTSLKVSVEQQENWIRVNLEKKDGYYFRILDSTTGEFCGTASLYNVKDNEAEFGRYICIKSIQAIEAEYLALRFAFTEMGLDRVYCRTAVDNKKVWKQHLSYGFTNKEEELLVTPDKELKLQIQELTHAQFLSTDYSFIKKLIEKF